MYTLSSLLTTPSGTARSDWHPGVVTFTGNEIAETIERLAAERRHHDFRKRTQSAILDEIDCPTIAACVLFHHLADENPRERALARDLIRKRLDGIVSEEQREEVMAYSAWVADQLVDPSEPMNHFRALWFRRLTRDERVELIATAEEVARANGRPTELQLKALKLLRRALSD